MKKISLSDLQKGARAIILEGTSVRMMEMGMTTGTEIEFLHTAPFGGSIAIRCRSTVIAIRLEDAGRIFVEKLS